jgi:hypothetical protein
MAKRGDERPEDPAMKEEREARVTEMLARAKRAHRSSPKKKVASKSARTRKKRHG